MLKRFDRQFIKLREVIEGIYERDGIYYADIAGSCYDVFCAGHFDSDEQAIKVIEGENED